MVETPDEIVFHKVEACECCGKNLKNLPSEGKEKRQQYDIPPMKTIVTEHQSERKHCGCGHLNYAFPAGVENTVQYGPNMKTLAVYLQNYQLLPYERTAEMFSDLFGHSPSVGSLYQFNAKAYQKLETFEDRLKQLLAMCMVLGFDETGFRVLAKCM